MKPSFAWKEFPAASVLSEQLAGISAGEAAALCDDAGVDRRHGARCRRGRRIPTDAFLALCAVAGIDPSSGRTIPVSEPGSLLRWFFACGLSVRRHLARMNIRDAARRAGVSASTFSAAERGKPVAVESFVKLATYVGVAPGGFTLAAAAGNDPISSTIQKCTSACFPGNAPERAELVPGMQNQLGSLE